MPASILNKMSVDEFINWAADQPGRYELINGEPVAVSPERAVHARIKANAWSALRNAIHDAGLNCEAFPDGMTIRISENTAYEPDALVQCGDILDDDAVEVTLPIIVVEVVSPTSTIRANDLIAKVVQNQLCLRYPVNQSIGILLLSTR
jgi:Uma2 family endonuclease